jgi:hypothetical protein
MTAKKMYGWVRDEKKSPLDLPHIVYLDPKGNEVWVDCVSCSETVNPFAEGTAATCVGEVTKFVRNNPQETEYAPCLQKILDLPIMHMDPRLDRFQFIDMEYPPDPLPFERFRIKGFGFPDSAIDMEIFNQVRGGVIQDGYKSRQTRRVD